MFDGYDYNVHIVPTIKIINDTISITGRNCLYVGDLITYLKSYSAVGLYDSVMAITSDCLAGAVTSLAIFERSDLMFGFTHSVILLNQDRNLVNKGYSNDYPHLHTTGYMYHEWLHQLSGYRKLDVFFPDIHGYNNPNLYSWNEDYFDNCPHAVSTFHNSFYRAILCAKLNYNNGTYSLKTGIYPLFWKITPRRILLGKYIIQNQSNEYCYNNNGIFSTSTSLSNENKYYWNVYYDFAINDLRVESFSYTSPVYCTINNCSFTRVGPYDEGMYLLVNLSLNNQILGYTESYIPEMTTYRSTPRQTFYSEYALELFATLSTSEPNQNTKLLKLVNNSDTEGNQVMIDSPGSSSYSQIWQFRFDENQQNCKIMPKRSPLKSLSFYASNLHITQNTNVQYWRPELVANGKFIFDGKYKIIASTGGFLTFNGNTLQLSLTGTEWQINFYSDNYYKISCTNGSSTYYFDVLNAYDLENNAVQVQYETSYTDAQTWKFMLNSNGKVTIVPRLSLTKGIKSTFSGSVLSSNPTLFTLIKIPV